MTAKVVVKLATPFNWSVVIISVLLGSLGHRFVDFALIFLDEIINEATTGILYAFNVILYYNVCY